MAYKLSRIKNAVLAAATFLAVLAVALCVMVGTVSYIKKT
jgi:hypothetical protein